MSWKTTVFGLLGLIGGLIPQFWPQYAKFGGFLSALAVGGMGLFARDNDKTSEQVNAGKAPSGAATGGTYLMVMLCTALLALGAVGCSGTFVQKSKKAEYAGLSLADGGMKAWAEYYHLATNNPAAYGTTLAAVELRHQQVNALAHKVSAGARAIDTFVAAYQTNSAVKPWLQAAVDSLGADAPQLVALVAGFVETNQFAPMPGH